VELEVLDVQRPVKGLVSHRALVRSGEIAADQKVRTQVDQQWRIGARQAHSGTHIVHAALRQVLGDTALQSGSYNKPGFLRLDFSWAQALSNETKSEIEEVTNLAIREDLMVTAQQMTLPEAKKWGAVALFGETYDETVRVVEIGGPWSRELCGGTHVSHSSQVGMVSLLGESSVGSGSRRIEALVGIEAFRALSVERALVSRLSELLKTPRETLEEKATSLVEELKTATRKLAGLQAQSLLSELPKFLDSAVQAGAFSFVIANIGDASSADDIRGLATALREKAGTNAAVIMAAGVVDGNPSVVIATNEPARGLGAKAGALIKIACSVLGGGGGGKDDIAQGGGTDSTKISAAIDAVTKELAK
jgi:alanyl-tRNA synthetase